VAVNYLLTAVQQPYSNGIGSNASALGSRRVKLSSEPTGEIDLERELAVENARREAELNSPRASSINGCLGDALDRRLISPSH
jgi:hypothetical protein